MFGGFTGTDSLASIETIDYETGEFWVEVSLEIPAKLHQHCVVYLLLYDFMVIGGIRDGHPSNKTYRYSSIYNNWREGPELNVPRSGASCGYINDYNQIVVAGGYNDDGYLSSTEVQLSLTEVSLCGS